MDVQYEIHLEKTINPLQSWQKQIITVYIIQRI